MIWKTGIYSPLMEHFILRSKEPLMNETPTAINKTLEERDSRYGDFTDHARICNNIKRMMECEKGWVYLDDVKKQALHVIADKIARILNGDPDYADNWHDIQGYAKLVEDRLPPLGQESVIKDCSFTSTKS